MRPPAGEGSPNCTDQATLTLTCSVRKRGRELDASNFHASGLKIKAPTKSTSHLERRDPAILTTIDTTSTTNSLNPASLSSTQRYLEILHDEQANCWWAPEE